MDSSERTGLRLGLLGGRDGEVLGVKRIVGGTKKRVELRIVVGDYVMIRRDGVRVPLSMYSCLL